ncbi:putative ddt domain-containing protein [Golovinomyces cichoracearum]|uniref:Putative ddt domain-containing protein n=1 Tax=Golovinomyces cichoracearum TaxID=62708 RepID=A0A420H8M9_9PEZI|nr:putative ddt domain-containing protein [Golovinomyces cichoracearum]
MVLFKRKPVKYLAPPKVENDETEVWEIKQTGEIFLDYESYLARIDFYKQRRFICQITGHSGLSFFEALKSELSGAQEVEEAFPEALKGPVLRRVQFQTISRINTLVDLIYDEFRADYYPGEAVTVQVVTGERLAGIVRDKTSFGAKILPDGTLNPPYSRYLVSLDDRPNEEAVVDDNHISRDRKIFTKQVLRSFIKNSVTRDSWNGAPWQVKHDLAKQYHIDTKIPPHLFFENKPIDKKMKMTQVRAVVEIDSNNGNFQEHSGSNSKLLQRDPGIEVQRNKQNNSHHLIKDKNDLSLISSQASNHLDAQSTSQPPYISHTFQVYGPISKIEPRPINFHNSTFTFAPQPILLQSLQPPRPPQLLPQIKYPIEDLQIRPRKEGFRRPALKFLSQDTPSNNFKPSREGADIQMKSVGLLLETWDTLNVFCEIFVLDSFTFDDFVEAMQIYSEDIECELFVEIHCAALKMLVASEADGGEILIPLLDMEEESDEEKETGQPSSISTPAHGHQPELRGRTTRSGLTRTDFIAQPRKSHRAAEMLAEVNWIDRLRKRNFKDGGWQLLLIGLLYQLSKIPRYFDVCNALLKELAPLDLDPTPETARKRYLQLEVNLRIQVLEILCMLIVDTKAVRTYMEECSEQMTSFRKEKIQWQRDRKQYIEELRVLNEERKALLPLNTPSSLSPENGTLTKLTVGEVEIPDPVEDDFNETDDDLRQIRTLRRGQDRALERKRKREAHQDKIEKADLESKQPKHIKQLTKLSKEIKKKQDLIAKCENEISTLDNDLREADCPRTRLLGRDRFWNRYFWFERNGMPYGGLPESSTAEADYANGCIWIQGPGDMERKGFIDMESQLQAEYKEKHQMTVPERKKLEEGSTSVYNAYQWGYYEDPESVDELLSWLDVRGCNEIRLHKELKLYRDRIISNMEKRKKYLKSWDEKTLNSGIKRMVTRRKESSINHAATYRCLAWRNTMAISEIGHLHSDQPRVRRSNKKEASLSCTKEPDHPSKAETKGRNKKNTVYR